MSQAPRLTVSVNSHIWIAGAWNSTLTAVRQTLDEDIPVLGPEALPREKRQSAQGLTPKGIKNFEAEMSNISCILSRFVIPLHLNVQYVEVF